MCTWLRPSSSSHASSESPWVLSREVERRPEFTQGSGLDHGHVPSRDAKLSCDLHLRHDSQVLGYGPANAWTHDSASTSSSMVPLWMSGSRSRTALAKSLASRTYESLL